MNQPADIPIEVGGAAYRIQSTSNINYDQPITPYAGGFVREAERFGQVIHNVDVYLAEHDVPEQTQIERVSGSKDVTPQGPPNVARTNVLNPAVAGLGETGVVAEEAIDGINRSRI